MAGERGRRDERKETLKRERGSECMETITKKGGGDGREKRKRKDQQNADKRY